MVRESIQNSADATREDVDRCIIKYNLKKFINEELSSCIEDYGNCFLEKFGTGQKEALVITDLNTTGLLGEAYETPNGNNNLFNLVYAFLKGKKFISLH